MSRVLVLAGGSPHAHDFAACGIALARIVTDLHHDVQVVAHPDEAAELLRGEGDDAVDALVVDGLWWRMLGDTYDQWRDEFGYSPSESTRSTLRSFVAEGGGMLAVHTTPICFDDWPEWGDVVGGAWRWGVSSHPPVGPVTAHIVGTHPVVEGLPAQLMLRDEVYGDMAVRDGVHVLAVAKRNHGDAEQPVVWAHSYGNGRVVFDGFGHDADSLNQPHHAQLLSQALNWVMAAS